LVSFAASTVQSQTHTYFFPPGSQPSLEELTIKNVGKGSVLFPRIIINEQSKYGSLDEIHSMCAKKSISETAHYLCLMELLHNNLKTISTGSIQKSTNFPTSILEALNYYGYSQCGPSSDFLVQLAQHNGDQACTINFPSHIVAQINLPSRPILLDPRRGLYYVSQDEDKLLSLKELLDENAFRNTPGDKGWLPLLNAYFNTIDFYKPYTEYCSDQQVPPLPLSNFSLETNDSLIFDRRYDKSLLGSIVKWTHRVTPENSMSILLPYPGLKMTFLPVEKKDTVKGNIRSPLRQPFDFSGEPIQADLARNTKRFSRVFQVDMDFESRDPVEMDITMRYAKNAFAPLVEGANTIRFEGQPQIPGSSEVEITLKIKKRVMRFRKSRPRE
jgi:hypothetical protein